MPPWPKPLVWLALAALMAWIFWRNIRSGKADGLGEDSEEIEHSSNPRGYWFSQIVLALVGVACFVAGLADLESLSSSSVAPAGR